MCKATTRNSNPTDVATEANRRAASIIIERIYGPGMVESDILDLLAEDVVVSEWTAVGRKNSIRAARQPIGTHDVTRRERVSQ